MLKKLLAAKVGVPLLGGALVGSFLLGGTLTHKLWNGHIKDQKIEALTKQVELKDAAYEAEKLITVAYKEINEGYRAAIETKDGEIASYANANVNLALSRSSSKEVIYTQGKDISNAEQAKDPKNPINYCLGVGVNERMRLFANGDVDLPAGMRLAGTSE